jgi:hypothetical protein
MVGNLYLAGGGLVSPGRIFWPATLPALEPKSNPFTEESSLRISPRQIFANSKILSSSTSGKLKNSFIVLFTDYQRMKLCHGILIPYCINGDSVQKIDMICHRRKISQ